MMRYRFLLLLFVLGLVYTGCEENEIEVYNETPRLNFYRGNTTVHFRDSDYVKGHTEKELLLRVDLQGDSLWADKNFCLKIQPNETYSLEANVSFEERYLFPANVINQVIAIKVTRPENLTTTKAYMADVCFDIDNPLHEFEPGRKDKASLPVEIYYRVRRDDWNTKQWSEYSDSKYFFMMDYFKATIDNIPIGEATQKEIYDAYEEYKKNNPPLLDENGLEIVFKRVE